MSRLIDADALIEELNLYEKELRDDREIAIESDDEQMLFAIMNQETAICRIRRNVLHIPTAYDIEKVVAELKKEMNDAITLWDDSDYYTGRADAFECAIEIVRKGGAT